ncbi:2-hydroxyacid dehydrogenase [Paractinoplanes hotanensis]|uniref:Uncharacterized protein n=1 Tax=Paractinoplanes hotanensis TaxID=2906497 RepID=A0ABT0XS91_9ACTN|nr:NAD(P)-dependent oxidoreductase [Actinoplanes hotanensis]MCM4076475.1 hypothetical protein [Actinoplanes hotanensis]
MDEPTYISDQFVADMKTLGDFEVFHDRPDPETTVARLKNCDIAIVEWTRLTAEILRATSRVRHISLVTTSYDSVDISAAAKNGITVAYCPGYSSQAVAEHVFALLLAVARRIFAGDAAVRSGGPITHAPFLGVQLAGRTLGLIGTGDVARAAARIASAFGMTVVGANRHGREAPGIELLPLDDVVARSDFLSLHAPLDETTRHILDGRRLGLLKDGAIVINTSRGELIDQEQLIQALTSGRLAGAGLDHLSEVSEDRIRALDNVVMTPGIAWYTSESRLANLDEVYKNVAAHLNGESRHVLPVPPRPQTRISAMRVATDDAFVPGDFEAPTGLRAGRFELVPLGPEHNERDFQAWMGSFDHIKKTPGFTEYPWPYVMTPEDNEKDLKQHAEDFKRRTGFTYTAMIDGVIAGCVYIYPLNGRPGQAAVRSWVIQDHAGLDIELYRLVNEWINAVWPFERVEYAPRELQPTAG